MTISKVVFDSIVTYSTGLDVSKLITGFETCTIRLANFPPDVKEEDVYALLRDRGIDTQKLHLILEKKPGRLARGTYRHRHC
ncbi:hypothetical protein JVU11DRAFT_7168 [Chiua virens]|nr:hypothetical protein JVU11DRAFT_7168 [Chiua virens]